MKKFNSFTTKDSYTRNITHNAGNTAVWNLKPEQWGSLLIQEKYQKEKACDKRWQNKTKQQRPHNRNSAHVECESKRDK